MIPLNQEQRLGHKAYILLLCRKMISGVIALLISLLVLAIGASTKGGLTKVLGWIHVSNSASISTAVNYVVIGLFLLTFVILVMNVLAARFQYKNHTFTFEEFDLKFKNGTFTSVVTSIPYRQMQDVNIERNMLHQFTGTSRITIDSAGQDEKGAHSKSDIELDPIDKDLAEEIRLLLQRKIGIQIVTISKPQ